MKLWLNDVDYRFSIPLFLSLSVVCCFLGGDSGGDHINTRCKCNQPYLHTILDTRHISSSGVNGVRNMTARAFRAEK